MARICELCGKGHTVGNIVSHANNKTKRLFSPNLQRIRVIREGVTKRIRVCTRCIRSGWITKGIRQSSVSA